LSGFICALEVIYTYRRENKARTEETKMHTTYTFKKNGKAYSAKANNRFEAQDQIELAFGISLKGATFEEVYKLRVVRTGKVR
jgi:hypothetical protein